MRVEIISSSAGARPVSAQAMHFPLVITQEQTAAGTPLLLRGDMIDTLLVAAPSPVFLRSLRVVPLASAAGGDWTRIEDIPVPRGRGNLLTPLPLSERQLPFVNQRNLLPLQPFSGVRDIVTQLFDPQVRDSSGAVVPMARRMLDTAPSDGTTISAPLLAFLQLTALDPSLARNLQLLRDLSFAGATTANANDLLLVGHWPARDALGSLGTVVRFEGLPLPVQE